MNDTPSQDSGSKMSRREFARVTALVALGATVSGGAVLNARLGDPPDDPRGEATIRNIPDFENLPANSGEDVVLRMERELRPAMAKPVEERKWVMIIDQRKCVGCHACTVGCVAENKLPPGVVYRPVVTEETGEFPHPRLKFTPRPCMQCEAPPCVPVCPVKATWRRPDGVVTIDYDRCIGCRYCLTACPYGARTSDFGQHYTDGVAGGAGGCEAVMGAREPYADEASHEYAKNWVREGHDSPVGNARKCHFCLHRLEKGQLPMCVTTCIGRATYFGDANNSDSLVSELLASNNTHTLLPHKGTKPRVFYID